MTAARKERYGDRIHVQIPWKTLKKHLKDRYEVVRGGKKPSPAYIDMPPWKLSFPQSPVALDVYEKALRFDAGTEQHRNAREDIVAMFLAVSPDASKIRQGMSKTLEHFVKRATDSLSALEKRVGTPVLVAAATVVGRLLPPPPLWGINATASASPPKAVAAESSAPMAATQPMNPLFRDRSFSCGGCRHRARPGKASGAAKVCAPEKPRTRRARWTAEAKYGCSVFEGVIVLVSAAKAPAAGPGRPRGVLAASSLGAQEGVTIALRSSFCLFHGCQLLVQCRMPEAPRIRGADVSGYTVKRQFATIPLRRSEWDGSGP